MRHLLPLALLSFALFACKGRQPATAQSSTSHFGSDADPVFFNMERTACFGKCPAYVVTLKADGSVKYDGRDNVPRQGIWTGQMDKASMQRLLDRAKSIGFFEMKDTYDGEVTDLPSTLLRFNADGKDKKVVGRYKMPPAFKLLAAYADSLLVPVQWTRLKEQQ